MRVLIDLQHPAELYVFKNIATLLRDSGHDVLFTGRDKDILIALARSLGERVSFFGRAKKGVFHLGMELLYRQFHLIRIIRHYRPNIILAVGGAFVALPGKLCGVPVHIFYDTEHASIANMLSYPFASGIHVPDCYNRLIHHPHDVYPGYHALAYLHPARFQPDPAVPASLGLSKETPFTIVRYVAWAAGHDLGRRGLSPAMRLEAVRRLATIARVFVSVEGEFPQELAPYRCPVPVHRMHDLMAFASLTFGESATMASEAAVLGVPGVYIDPVGRGYTDDLERRYGLVRNFHPEQEQDAVETAVSLLADHDAAHWQACRQRLLAEKIDVTAHMFNIVTRSACKKWMHTRKLR